jgi:mono/diheme cytochrome c family protein
MRHRIGAVLLSIAVSTGCATRVPEDATGEQIYMQLCARCHGAELEGRVGPALGVGSNSASQPDEFLVFTIDNGRGRMPSFSSTLRRNQIDRLVAFIREVQAR